MDTDTALILFREFVSLPIIQAILVVAALVIVFAGTILTKISTNTKKQTELTSTMVGHLSAFATERAKSDEERITDLEKRIKTLEDLRAIDQQALATANVNIARLEEQLRLVTEERDKLVKQLQEQTELSGEALRTLGKLRDALERTERKRGELEEQIESKNKQIADLTKERDELLNKIAAITEQMAILRNRLTDVEKKAGKPTAETGVMVKNDQKEEKKKDEKAA